MKSDSNPDYNRFIKNSLSGCFAGIVGTVFGHPLDVVKTRLQTQTGYKGAIDCFMKIAKTEGLTNGLYRGILPPLVSLTFLNTLSFSTYGQFKSLMRATNEHFGLKANTDFASFEGLQRWQYFLAGGWCGFSLSVVSTPFELVKVRMQLDNITEKRFRNSWHCARTLVREHGVKLLYTGYFVNNLREIAFCSVYFGLYEHFKNTFAQALNGEAIDITVRPTVISPLAILFAGGLSGASAWFASFPLDVLKSNIQGLPIAIAQSKNRPSMLQVMKDRWRLKGIRGFYSGLGPSVTRAFIVSSTRFSAFEFMMQILTKMENSWNQ